MSQSYLAWMAENTPSRYCNDSALTNTVTRALNNGAIGVTTNAPLSYEALTSTQDQDLDPIDTIDETLTGDERVLELIGRVVRPLARRFEPMFNESRGRDGYVRCQVQPSASGDYDKQLEQGLRISEFGPNVMVKIPGTASGIRVLEELAARGIPTTATVCVSAPQIMAAADAYERGCERARAAGITPAPSTSAFVMGRLQDYLAAVNEEQNLHLETQDLEEAVLAVARRLIEALKDRPNAPKLMPAAFRAPRQVTLLAGAPFEATIHPKIQDALIEWDEKEGIPREIGIDQPLHQERIDRVLTAIPDFKRAYELNGLSNEEFDEFGATVMTLGGFTAAWDQLRTL
ncbi:transaldolase family protein [Schaalia vaccimaxillae]|uniref:transaldolase family protein n=1 Tax=Schaalia vaccimaxillae TaxID=183916 RepID=UPI0003B4B22B|nr:transaldolase family protein [Schaalia vaccimaxillae]